MAQVKANHIILEYEQFGDRSQPTIILIMGITNQLIDWPISFCQGLADQGYCVIRFDNRDCGLSQKMSDAPADLDMALALSAGVEIQNVAYTLEHMADDTLALIKALGFQTAHLVGYSLGGMIAQLAALKAPESISSLTLMMTSGKIRNLNELPNAVLGVFRQLCSAQENKAAEIALFQLCRFSGNGDRFGLTKQEAYEWAKRDCDRQYYPQGIARNLIAMAATPSFQGRLSSIGLPSLIIHGTSDPEFPLQDAEDLNDRIPNSELHVVEGMGHNHPESLVPMLIKPIDSFLQSI